MDDLDERAWTDPDRDTHRITEVLADGPDYWDVCWGKQCTNLKMSEVPDGVSAPRVGDLITYWPAGGWWRIRGKALNGRVFFYREETHEEWEAKARLHRKLVG